MKNCSMFENELKKFISGEITAAEKDSLSEHSAECLDCRKIIETHQLLSQKSNHPEIPPAENFNRMRENVLSAVSSAGQKILTVKRAKILHFPAIRRYFIPLTAAAAMLISGFFIGKYSTANADKMSDGLIQQINVMAQENKQFSDVQNSPYMYSNVSIHEAGDQMVSLSFDVTTHLEIKRKRNDVLVKDILAQSILNSPNLGNRLKSITFAGKIIDPKIKQALLFSVLKDKNLAVRMKAMDIITRYKMDPDIESAFIEILLKEVSVQMRLNVLDYLTNNKINPDTLNSVVSRIDDAKGGAIKIKAQDLIRANK